MSEPTEQPAIDAASLVQAAEPAEKGAASRFDKLAKERGLEPQENGITLKQQQDWQNAPDPDKPDTAKPTETKPDDKPADKPAKDAVPDFSKKPEEKKPEANHDEELKQHPAVKGEAAKSFKSVLAQRDEFKTKAAELEAKIKELESRPQTKGNDDKIAEYEKRMKDLENELGRSNFGNSPKIQAFASQEKLQVDAAKSYLDGDDAQQAAVETASNLTGQKRLRALVDSGMNSETVAAVSAHLARVDDIRAQKTAAMNNWQQEAKAFEQEQQTEKLRADQQRKEFEETVFKTVLDKSIPKLEGLQKVDGYEDWNQGVEGRIATIKRLYNGQADLPEIAEVIAKGVAYDAKDQLYANLYGKYQTVAQELASLKAAANPKGDVRQGGDKSVQESGTPGSRFEATKAGLRG